MGPLAAYIGLWLRGIIPGKLAKSAIRRDRQDIVRILPDTVKGGFLRHNPARRTDRYAGRTAEKRIADAETVGKLIFPAEEEIIKYKTCFKPVVATGMRRDECCALQGVTSIIRIGSETPSPFGLAHYLAKALAKAEELWENL